MLVQTNVDALLVHVHTMSCVARRVQLAMNGARWLRLKVVLCMHLLVLRLASQLLTVGVAADVCSWTAMMHSVMDVVDEGGT
jgi:hypothetical protein